MKHFIFLLLPLTVISQSIKAKVYDNETTVKGIKIYNISKQIQTYTDEEGEFNITASVNDTIFLESLFHYPKRITIQPFHFKNIVVFELKKSVNALGEVLLSNKNEDKFNPLEYTQTAESALARDIKRNQHLYIPASSYTNGANFGEIFKLIKKIFRKKKNQHSNKKFISFKILDSLFKNDKLFNLNLLRENLNISDEYAYLFFDYCETKTLDKALLEHDTKVILLDSLVNYSKSFLQITKKFEESKDTLNLKK